MFVLNFLADERGPTSFTGLFSKPPKIADIPILPEVIETNIPHIENPVSPLANDVENKPMPATIAQLCRKANKSLRPWITNEIESNALKTFVCCKKMLEPIPLEDYFKCMASACFFTTSKLGEIEEHIESHLGAPGSLHCAYCSLVAEDSIELTSHIASEHKMDVYHCRYCFYRCCMVGHQVEHLKKYHPDEEPLYICEQEANQGKPPTKEPYEMRDVQKARQMFVPPLVCKGIDKISHWKLNFTSYFFYFSLHEGKLLDEAFFKPSEHQAPQRQQGHLPRMRGNG